MTRYYMYKTLKFLILSILSVKTIYWKFTWINKLSTNVNQQILYIQILKAVTYKTRTCNMHNYKPWLLDIIYISFKDFIIISIEYNSDVSKTYINQPTKHQSLLSGIICTSLKISYTQTKY